MVRHDRLQSWDRVRHMSPAMSPRHPAVRAKSRLYARWSCFICGQDGVGGVHGWSDHYTAHHYTPGETP